uniref:Uncharacterized protein n=1 Tax=Nelumbo nucifera TaxID=4432 RepID=A0A822Z6E1_NELNU|nr:TPA_asm: hypothetical protein HUJ06_014730 [Nelumbo nucifera]
MGMGYWGWGAGGGGGGGWFRWGCGGATNPNGERGSRRSQNHNWRNRKNEAYKMGEYAQCMGKGRCMGMKLDCPLHCGGPCFYDCEYMCRAHCRRP